MLYIEKGLLSFKSLNSTLRNKGAEWMIHARIKFVAWAKRGSKFDHFNTWKKPYFTSELRNSILTAERKKAVSWREQRRRRYLGVSSEEGAISERAAKKALSRRKQRRRRYLGTSCEKVAISAAEVALFSELAPR